MVFSKAVREGIVADRFGEVCSWHESVPEEQNDESVWYAMEIVELVAWGAILRGAALRGLRVLAVKALVVTRVESAVRQRAWYVGPDVRLLAVRETELAVRSGLEVSAQGTHEVAGAEEPSRVLNRPRRGT